MSARTLVNRIPAICLAAATACLAPASAPAGPLDRPEPRQISGDANPRHRSVQLDDPAGEYTVEPLNGDSLLRITGRTKILRVTSVDGAAMLDASQLQAGDIVVTGSIGGGTIVRLHASRGRVEVQGAITGGARVDIAAPEGTVVLGSDGRPAVTGGVRVQIATHDFTLRGSAEGGARVHVALSRSGSLKFTRLENGSQLTFHKVDPEDATSRVESGEILGGAAFGELNAQSRVIAETRATPREAVTVSPFDRRTGPMIEPGITLLDGDRVTGAIVSVNATTVVCRLATGETKSVELTKAAAIVLSAIPQASRDRLDVETAGVLLRSGDFLEGTGIGLRDNRIDISSVVFGPKAFEAGRDVVAVVLHRGAAAPPATERSPDPAPLPPRTPQ